MKEKINTKEKRNTKERIDEALGLINDTMRDVVELSNAYSEWQCNPDAFPSDRLLTAIVEVERQQQQLWKLRFKILEMDDSLSVNSKSTASRVFFTDGRGSFRRMGRP